jgi:hypothetical protein
VGGSRGVDRPRLPSIPARPLGPTTSAAAVSPNPCRTAAGLRRFPREMDLDHHVVDAHRQIGINQTAARWDGVNRKHHALVRRLIDRQNDHLRFTCGWRVAADNNGSRTRHPHDQASVESVRRGEASPGDGDVGVDS